MATVYPQTWERTLLPLAYEAEHRVVAPTPVPVSDTALLDRAYAYCDAITSTHSRTFYVATGLLPSNKRRAMRALYAFCRLSDDIVDCSQVNAEVSLATWRLLHPMVTWLPSPGRIRGSAIRFPRAMLNSSSTASGVTCARNAIARSRRWLLTPMAWHPPSD